MLPSGSLQTQLVGGGEGSWCLPEWSWRNPCIHVENQALVLTWRVCTPQPSGASLAVDGSPPWALLPLSTPGSGELPSSNHWDRVAFEEVSGHRVLIKSGPENRCRSARGPSHMASLEFPPETGLILRCTRKAGNPFQRKQGNRLSCRDQEGRTGSDEAVPGLSVFPRGYPACRGAFGGRTKGVRYCFALQGGTWDFP